MEVIKSLAVKWAFVLSLYHTSLMQQQIYVCNTFVYFSQLFRLAHLLGLDGMDTPVAMTTAGMPMSHSQGYTSILIATTAIEVRLMM